MADGRDYPVRHRRSTRQIPPSLNHFQRHRRHFSIKVYVLSTAFICLTVLQWLVIIINANFLEYFRARYYLIFLSAFGALILLTIFAFFDEVRHSQPYNWIFVLLIVELGTYGLLRALLDCDLDQFVMCLIATTTVVVVFSFIGFKLQRDLTRDILPLTVISLVFYFVTCFMLILVIATDMYFPSLFFIGIMMVLLLMYIMYDAQLISGMRAGTIRWNDFILAALLVYFNFTVMCTLTLFVASTLSNNAFLYNTKGQWPFD